MYIKVMNHLINESKVNNYDRSLTFPFLRDGCLCLGVIFGLGAGVVADLGSLGAYVSIFLISVIRVMIHWTVRHVSS